MPDYSPISCETCGETFTPKRSTARYCSDRCRYHKHLANTKRVTIPADLRFSILYRDGFACRYCGDRPPRKQLKVDHVMSVADGGPLTDPDNLVTACTTCNAGKSDLSLDPADIPPPPDDDE